MLLMKLFKSPLMQHKIAQFAVVPSYRSASQALSTKLKKVSKVSTLDTFGQPTNWTHPHLIKAGELVPCVMVEEFKNRRTELMAKIQKYALDNFQKQNLISSNHLVIIPSSTKKFMSEKIPYVFRQNSDFFYLSGCLEPDTILMLNVNERNIIKSTLFMRQKDKHAELWDGPRTGVDNATEMFGVDEAYAVESFSTHLKRLVDSEKPNIWYDYNNSDLHNITEKIRQASDTEENWHSPTKVVQSMRIIKSLAEQNLMRRTCQIASEAINEVIRETRAGYSEHHIYAMLDYKCRLKNASYLAYPPVVASGNNATTIHYINNNQLTKCGDLVLMDAGCEYGGYTSDITRTWPVNGTFSVVQKVLYDVLLQVQKELIDTLLKKGGETLDNLFDTMCIKIGKALQEVGLVSKSVTDEVAYAQAGYKFCPHHVSHYLGMDVHDTPLIPRTLPLKPGMICTVEPGIYIGHDRTDVPKEFRGLGLRVEDDVLIKNDHTVEVLTSNCIKERVILENLQQQLF